ncbi:unnamed protein product [Owenia fusiformis]|uniref:Uncharacterized protein n=1 Tax=Owenia fusiformis TaxID=6347 RepID=A0A8J1UCC4_OWEFU|nr:unnamed protein product [Owenia fusiformis]
MKSNRPKEVVDLEPDDSHKGVRLKRKISLMHACGIIIGTVIGSGIFISPKGVVLHSGSYGAAILVWVFGGIVNTCAAFIFLELALITPEAGGIYAYCRSAFGPWASFMVFWADFVRGPLGACVLARVSAIYVMEMINFECATPNIIVTLLALWFLISVHLFNAYSVSLAAGVNTAFTFIKTGALVLIIALGLREIGLGNSKNLESNVFFSGSSTNPAEYALAIYSGFFAYGGHENLGILVEEIKNPLRNLPRAVMISMTVVTIVYVLTNLAYFTVMTPTELLSSPAVALSFAKGTVPMLVPVISLAVACSTFGSNTASILTKSRVTFRVAREKEFPAIFNMINMHYITPMPAVIVQCIMVLFFVWLTDIGQLITYTSLVSRLNYLLAFVAFFWLRYKKPHLYRPIRMNIVLAAFTTLILLGLTGLAVYGDPIPALGGIGVFFSGIPFYFFWRFIRNRDLGRFSQALDNITIFLQLFLQVVPEEIIEKEVK